MEGVQFHPESILTAGGHDLLRNFLAASRRARLSGRGLRRRRRRRAVDEVADRDGHGAALGGLVAAVGVLVDDLAVLGWRRGPLSSSIVDLEARCPRSTADGVALARGPPRSGRPSRRDRRSARHHDGDRRAPAVGWSRPAARCGSHGPGRRVASTPRSVRGVDLEAVALEQARRIAVGAAGDVADVDRPRARWRRTSMTVRAHRAPRRSRPGSWSVTSFSSASSSVAGLDPDGEARGLQDRAAPVLGCLPTTPGTGSISPPAADLERDRAALLDLRAARRGPARRRSPSSNVVVRLRGDGDLEPSPSRVRGRRPPGSSIDPRAPSTWRHRVVVVAEAERAGEEEQHPGEEQQQHHEHGEERAGAAGGARRRSPRRRRRSTGRPGCGATRPAGGGGQHAGGAGVGGRRRHHGLGQDAVALAEAAQVGAQVLGRGVPVGRVLGQALEDDRLERRRHRRVDLPGRRRATRAPACRRWPPGSRR